MGMKPDKTAGFKRVPLSSTAVGACVGCKSWIFKHQTYARVRGCATGLAHYADPKCVPDCAVVVEVMEP